MNHVPPAQALVLVEEAHRRVKDAALRRFLASLGDQGLKEDVVFKLRAALHAVSLPHAVAHYR